MLTAKKKKRKKFISIPDWFSSKTNSPDIPREPQQTKFQLERIHIRLNWAVLLFFIFFIRRSIWNHSSLNTSRISRNLPMIKNDVFQSLCFSYVMKKRFSFPFYRVITQCKHFYDMFEIYNVLSTVIFFYLSRKSLCR